MLDHPPARAADGCTPAGSTVWPDKRYGTFSNEATISISGRSPMPRGVLGDKPAQAPPDLVKPSTIESAESVKAKWRWLGGKDVLSTCEKRAPRGKSAMVCGQHLHPALAVRQADRGARKTSGRAARSPAKSFKYMSARLEGSNPCFTDLRSSQARGCGHI